MEIQSIAQKSIYILLKIVNAFYFFDLNKYISIYLRYKTIHAFRDITTRTRRFPETIVYS